MEDSYSSKSSSLDLLILVTYLIWAMLTVGKNFSDNVCIPPEKLVMAALNFHDALG